MAAEAPPSHLSGAAKAWWKAVLSDYRLEEHDRKLLQLACEAWDAAQDARAVRQRKAGSTRIGSARRARTRRSRLSGTRPLRFSPSCVNSTSAATRCPTRMSARPRRRRTWVTRRVAGTLYADLIIGTSPESLSALYGRPVTMRDLEHAWRLIGPGVLEHHDPEDVWAFRAFGAPIQEAAQLRGNGR